MLAYKCKVSKAMPILFVNSAIALEFQALNYNGCMTIALRLLQWVSHVDAYCIYSMCVLKIVLE